MPIGSARRGWSARHGVAGLATHRERRLHIGSSYFAVVCTCASEVRMPRRSDAVPLSALHEYRESFWNSLPSARAARPIACGAVRSHSAWLCLWWTSLRKRPSPLRGVCACVAALLRGIGPGLAAGFGLRMRCEPWTLRLNALGHALCARRRLLSISHALPPRWCFLVLRWPPLLLCGIPLNRGPSSPSCCARPSRRYVRSLISGVR